MPKLKLKPRLSLSAKVEEDVKKHFAGMAYRARLRLGTYVSQRLAEMRQLDKLLESVPNGERRTLVQIVEAHIQHRTSKEE